MTVLRTLTIFCLISGAFISETTYALGNEGHNQVDGNADGCFAGMNVRSKRMTQEEIKNALLKVVNCPNWKRAEIEFKGLMSYVDMEDLYAFKMWNGQTFLHRWIRSNDVKDDYGARKKINTNILTYFLNSFSEKLGPVRLRSYINSTDQDQKTVLDDILSQDEMRAREETPPRSDVYMNKLEMLKSLLNVGAATTLRDYLELVMQDVYRHLNMDIVQAFLDVPNMDINQADSHGRTALHIALQSEKLDMVGRMLIKKGADLYFQDDFRKIPLDLVPRNGTQHLVAKIQEIYQSEEAIHARDLYMNAHPDYLSAHPEYRFIPPKKLSIKQRMSKMLGLSDTQDVTGLKQKPSSKNARKYSSKVVPSDLDGNNSDQDTVIESDLNSAEKLVDH